MLAQAELIRALKAGQGVADCCTTFCRVGAEVNADSPTLTIFHNGTGPRDTDVQVVHATVVLGYDVEKFGKHIGGWVKGLHRGERLDLNLVR